MRRPCRRGFTLTELMVVMGMAAIIMAASWGSFAGMIRTNRLTGATNEIVTHMRLAREKAVSEGNNYIVTFRVGQDDYRVWDDESSDALGGPTDSERTFALPTSVSFTTATFSGSNRITFRPDGTSDASGFVRLTNGEYLRQINVVAATGKVTVTTP